MPDCFAALSEASRELFRDEESVVPASISTTREEGVWQQLPLPLVMVLESVLLSVAPSGTVSAAKSAKVASREGELVIMKDNS
jgi:hypothetical protein